MASAGLCFFLDFGTQGNLGREIWGWQEGPATLYVVSKFCHVPNHLNYWYKDFSSSPESSSLNFYTILEDTARYAGLLLAPAEVFFAKKRAHYAVSAHFWKFLVSSSNLGNFK